MAAGNATTKIINSKTIKKDQKKKYIKIYIYFPKVHFFFVSKKITRQKKINNKVFPVAVFISAMLLKILI